MDPISARVFLFELRGANPGSVRIVPEGVLRMGSDTENDLVLQDRNISLYQAEIRVSGAACTIRNLSPQGHAFVNGEPFTEVELKRGDILTLGETMFRVVFPGEALSQRDLWLPVGGKQEEPSYPVGPWRRASFLTVLSLLAVAVVVFVVLLQRKGREEPELVEDHLPGYQAGVDIHDRQVRYDYGVGLITARRWDEAVLVFEKIRRDTPNYKDTDSLYQQALRESASLDALTLGKGLLLEGDPAPAKMSFAKVPESSVYFREASRLSRGVDISLAEARLEEAERHLAAGEWALAMNLARSVLSDDPDNNRARRILRDADLQQRRASVVWQSAGTGERAGPPVERKPPPAPAIAKRRVPPVRRAPAGTPEWHLQEAAIAYQHGNVDGALRSLEPVLRSNGKAAPVWQGKARQMAEDLRGAKAYYEKAKMLQDKGQLPEALELWRQFLERDQRASAGVPGLYFDQASARLSRICYQRGREEFDHGDLPGAFRFWNMAEKMNANDEEVRNGLESLAASAQEIYREGYVLQSLNPPLAAEKWRTVLEIVPPRNPYYERARAGLMDARNLELRGSAGVSQQPARVLDTSPRGLYREGYTLSDLNPAVAVAKWKEVLAKTTPADPYYQLARKQILQYEKPY